MPVKRLEDFELQDLVDRFIRKDSILGIESMKKKEETPKNVQKEVQKHQKEGKKQGFEYKRSTKQTPKN